LQKKKFFCKKIYNGYWQDIFFSNYLNLEKLNHNLFKINVDLPEKYYIAHFRGGDFFTSKAHIVLDESYYRVALTRFQNFPIIAIGDKDHAQNILKKINNKNITYLNLDEFNSFSTIINSCGGIASNSTFCWWGIYINLRKNKLPFVFPKTWMKNILYQNSKIKILNTISI